MGNSDGVVEVSASGAAAEETKEEKKEEKKPLFDPHNSAAMAKIAQVNIVFSPSLFFSFLDLMM